LKFGGFGFKIKFILGCLLNEASNYNGNNGDRTEVYVGAETLKFFFYYYFHISVFKTYDKDKPNHKCDFVFELAYFYAPRSDSVLRYNNSPHVSLTTYSTFPYQKKKSTVENIS